MTGGSGRVIVVGSLNVDLVVAGARLPAPGETVLGGTFRRFHGGKGGNQAVAAARLGADVGFVGAVGDDPFGDEAREALVRQGIDVQEVTRQPGVATGVALILVDETGENQISVAPGANGTLTAGTVRDALARLNLRGRDVVLAGHEIPTEAMVAALEAGHSAGARTICNPAPADGLTFAGLAAADVLTPIVASSACSPARAATRWPRRGGCSRPVADVPTARCSCRSALTARSSSRRRAIRSSWPLRGSRRSMPPVPATRSTAPWQPRSPMACRSPRRPAGRSWPPACP